jgi:hypothetical protein
MFAWMKRVFLFISLLLFSSFYEFAKGIDVIGKGVAPPVAKHPSQARLMAERAAKLDGYRQIVDKLRSEGYRLEETKEGVLIKGAKVIQTKYLEDGTIQVVMTYQTED